MEPAISRVNSWSTGRTLIGSDNGKDSLTYSTIDGTAGQIPIVRTLDNKQWVDLDDLSPKAIKELRRQYNVSNGDDGPGTLAKGAAKLKAWIRLSKIGVDVRLRHKVSADRDEVNVYHLERHPSNLLRDEKRPVVPELDGTPLEVVAELEEPLPEFPDTSGPSELSAATASPRISTDRSNEEPLPKYEPRDGPVGTPDHTNSEEFRPVSRQGYPDTLHRHSSSQESIAPGPEVLLLSDRNTGSSNEVETAAHPFVEPSAGDGQYNLKSSDHILDISQRSSATAKPEADQDQRVSESLQEIIALLHKKYIANGSEEDNKAVEDVSRRQGNSRRLQITSTESYETETDVEPPLVRKKTVNKPKGRRPATILPKRRKSSSAARSPVSFQPSIASDDDDRPTQELLRKQTLPKRSPASAGPEALWQSLLRSQAKILGAEHPMVYQAKSDLAQSRANSHADCRQHLMALQKTRESAVQTLGVVHPWVAAFCDELERLEGLTGAPAEVEDAKVYTGQDTDVIRNDSNQQIRVDGAELSISETVRDSSVPVPSPSVAETKSELPKLDVNALPSNDRNASPVMRSAEVDVLWNVSRQRHRPQSGFNMLSGLVFEAVTNIALNSIQWLQRNCGPESPVQPGKARVRWTCSCGKQLHDDYVELRRGAARELEAYLNRPWAMTTYGNTPTSPSSSNDTGSFMGSSVGGTQSSVPSWSSYGSQIPSSGGTGNGNKPPQSAAGTYLYPGYVLPSEPPWLLTCANEDRYTPKLAHLDMGPHHIRSDKDLALSLRQHYFQVNKKWWRSLRIRGLTTIEFVQFEVHQNRFADIRKCPDVPTFPNDQYEFMPGDLLPPVGSQYLLHLFKHPGDYDGELITYLRAPKRKVRLQSGVGWGINLV